MKKGIILGAFLCIASLQGRAQSTASGSSNTGTPTANATPAQNGSTGGTVAPKSSSMAQGQLNSNGRKMKTNSKTTKTRSTTSSGR
ncbi:hypothetical protein [Spirosoma agri]|uniref:Uncharacterized protein n=1 Tax=Spirosoma agri TaxID=1987381 RepID=A0A6M0IBI9_9BACT|nr:hypothetical protein [Spirosoma agri]NEU65509.1 hypothetical protein [Spirosoma agri]